MDKNITYYLSHPCTTFGNAYQNTKSSQYIHDKLKSKGNIIINPLTIIPEHLDWVTAMIVSRELYDKCDALIIGSPIWLYSKGCTEEVKWAIEDKKPIYLYREGEIHLVFDNDLQRFQYMIDNRDEIISNK